MCAKYKTKRNININNIIDNAWLGLGDVDDSLVDNLRPTLEDAEYYGLYPLRFMRNPEYVAYACKVLLNLSILPEQAVILSEFFVKPFPMFIASRGFGKSLFLGVYSMLQMALTPKGTSGGAGVKIVIVSPSYRQSRFVFDYMETIWNNAPRLRSVCKTYGKYASGPYRETDKHTMRVGENWTVAIPLGVGDKIRGLRGNIILVDEFDKVPINIYESVIQGFASVTSNPIDNVKRVARNKKMIELGVLEKGTTVEKSTNQIILSGTAGYDFGHFANYWKMYKGIIESKGNIDVIKQIFDGEVPRNFDWRDYSIIRFPYELIPEGFMAAEIVARARATANSSIYNMEYGCVFSKDSSGFFPRSLIESCVASDLNVNSPNWPAWGASFDVSVRGNLDKKYVIAVDPASEVDNFSIVVLELYAEHARVVYCWTTTKKRFRETKKANLTNEDDFYAYCARKIRDLLILFPSDDVAIDAQGGGISVIEALHDKRNMFLGETQIWPVIDPDKPADTDNESGLHIIHQIQFAKYEWVCGANHGMKKDLEDKTLLFPRFDTLSLEIASVQDNVKIEQFKKDNPGKNITLYDTFEDCVMEMEALKDELTTIIVTVTGTGVNSRDRWDTPEIKTLEGKKGRMKKDRYSALLMANMIARQKRVKKAQIVYDFGGLIMDDSSEAGGELYGTAPDWYKDMYDDIIAAY